jgi:predicted DNA-binding protein (MmcQ/YjbR family)
MSRSKTSSKTNPILARLHKLCLALPGTAETLTWGHPNFRVDHKIFVGYGDEGGRQTIGVKVGKARQKELLRDRRFTYADYVGRFGWVTMSLAGRLDWDEIAGLILTSYRLIAPRKLLSAFEGDAKVTRPNKSEIRRGGPKRRS